MAVGDVWSPVAVGGCRPVSVVVTVEMSVELLKASAGGLFLFTSTTTTPITVPNL